uniref:Uncharacterized protein n=1 Tax=Glossina pallidipes TaxID=7398 RepID=A0A1B0ACU0_GLOPL
MLMSTDFSRGMEIFESLLDISMNDQIGEQTAGSLKNIPLSGNGDDYHTLTPLEGNAKFSARDVIISNAIGEGHKIMETLVSTNGSASASSRSIDNNDVVVVAVVTKPKTKKATQAVSSSNVGAKIETETDACYTKVVSLNLHNKSPMFLTGLGYLINSYTQLKGVRIESPSTDAPNNICACTTRLQDYQPIQG